MRIGLDILSEIAGHSSGTETYLLGFLKALERASEKQYEFFLFVNSGNKDFYKKIAPNFHRVNFPFSNHHRPLRVLSQWMLIPYHSRRLKLDLVNYLGTSGSFCGPNISQVQHIKSLHHYRYSDSLGITKEKFLKLMTKYSARTADIVIANSKNTKKEIVQYLGVTPKRVLIIPEAVDHNTFFPIKKGDAYGHTLEKYCISSPYLLFVSSLWPYKNVHGLIKAYSYLTNNYDLKHYLVIAGGLFKHKYHAQLNKMIYDYKLDNRVLLLGHITDRSKIRDLYVGADLFVYPSYAETFGLTLLESMACGIPVIASNRASIPEVTGDAAILINPDNYIEIAKTIWKILTDRNLRKLLVEKGLKRAKEFTWENTAIKTLAAYELAKSLKNR